MACSFFFNSRALGLCYAVSATFALLSRSPFIVCVCVHACMYYIRTCSYMRAFEHVFMGWTYNTGLVLQWTKEEMDFLLGEG